MTKFLIVGIDPGTTLGYAILDLEGNLVELNSSKELNIDLLIRSVYKFGKPILLGCDKHKIPGFVLKFGEKVRAVVDWPKKDLSTEEKKLLAKNINCGDCHEKDALASAMFAYNNVKGLFDRIDSFLKKENKIWYSDKVKEIMVKNPELNIPAALLLLAPKEKAVHKEKSIIGQAEQKLHPDFSSNLKNKLKRLETENRLIKKQNRKFKNKIQKLKVKIVRLANDKIIILDNKIKNKIDLKDKNLLNQYKLNEKNDELITANKDEIARLNYILSKLHDKVLLKKLDNLGSEEYDTKNRILNIGEKDILLVSNCGILSQKILNLLKENLNIIIYKNKINKNVQRELCSISSKKFNIFESEHFALIDKRELETQLKNQDLLDRVIDEHRKRNQIP